MHEFVNKIFYILKMSAFVFLTFSNDLVDT